MAIIIGTGGNGGGGSTDWSSVTGKPTIQTTVGDPGSDSNLVSEQAVREAVELGGGGAAALDDLTDVTVATPAAGETLVYVVDEFVNQPYSYDDLSNVPTEFAPESHTHVLADITNVNITTPSDGQFLQYDSGASEWINSTPSLGDFGDVDEVVGSNNDFFVKNSGQWTNRTPAQSRVHMGVDQVGIQINYAAPEDGTFTVAQSMPFAGAIQDIVHQLSAGSVNVTIQINGTNVTGIVAEAVATSEVTDTASAANTFAAGDLIGIVFASGSSPANYSGTLRITR